MDIGSVIIAVAGVAGTLGGSFLTQRAAERGKLRELALIREQEDARESRQLRRTCYAELNRDARQFSTALNGHLHAMRERGVEEADRTALDEAKAAHRDRYSEAMMVAPDGVLAAAAAANRALTALYGHVKRLERGEPEPGESPEAAARAREEVWALLATMRTAMRRDLGVAEDPEPSDGDARGQRRALGSGAPDALAAGTAPRARRDP
ncbi:hypothetical protein LG634_33695 [Streptomyces bambusae]|uniref:hypothetical protein n=1 Tax=Streptomyces bambusae TaxID=1550616 RepID=UPI001CFFB345|nr:hypothetical protein [Streptomyces bambusae]MCB5169741.1 hypothetical protein [Streptomyces bambusae]